MNLADHLDKLKAFAVIAESKTMREAADRLNVTQPSLTRLIQTLEHATKTKLLMRSRSGTMPTDAGKVLLRFAQSTLKDLKNLEIELQSPQDQLAGHLTVGSYESLTEYLWPDFIADFNKRYPQLKISIRTSDSINHSYALGQGLLDLLVDAEPRLVGDFSSWELYQDRFQFYVGSSKAAKDTLIYSPMAFDSENKKIITYVEEAGFFFKDKIELDSFPSVLAFCKRDLGVAVMPQRLAQKALQQKEIALQQMKGFSVKGFGQHSLYATVYASRKDDPKLKLLIKSLRNWFGNN